MTDGLVLYQRDTRWLETTPLEMYSTTWTPAQFGGYLLAWYDATTQVYNDAGVTLASDGEPVQQWNDISGHGYHISQVTSQARPTYRSTHMNGNPTLQFVAASTQSLKTSSNAVVLGTDQLTSFFVTWMFSGTQNDGRLGVFHASTLASSQPSWNNVESVVLIYRDFNRNMIRSGRNVFIGWPSDVTTASPFRMGSLYDGSFTYTYQNSNRNEEEFPEPSSGAFGAFGAIGIGSDVASSAAGTLASWDGYVSEAVLVSRALLSSEIIQLDSYFRWKWNLFP